MFNLNIYQEKTRKKCYIKYHYIMIKHCSGLTFFDIALFYSTQRIKEIEYIFYTNLHTFKHIILKIQIRNNLTNSEDRSLIP